MIVVGRRRSTASVVLGLNRDSISVLVQTALLAINLVRLGSTAIVVGDGLSGSGSEDGGTAAKSGVDVEGGGATAIVVGDAVAVGNRSNTSITAQGLGVVKGNSATAGILVVGLGVCVHSRLAGRSIGTARVLGEIVGGATATIPVVGLTVGDSVAATAKITSGVVKAGTAAIGSVVVAGEDVSITTSLGVGVVLSVARSGNSIVFAAAESV